eukprot:8727197-Pyramimonas_sp.AAC.1
MQCERLECSFMLVEKVERCFAASAITFCTSPASLTGRLLSLRTVSQPVSESVRKADSETFSRLGNMSVSSPRVENESGVQGAGYNMASMLLGC